MTEIVTDLEILEELEFHDEQICTWVEITGHEHPAHVYVKRTAPCPCYPNGRVFPACRNWLVAHTANTSGMTNCCFTQIGTGKYVELGPIL